MGWLNGSVSACSADEGRETYEGHGDSSEYGSHQGARHNPVMSQVYEVKSWVNGIQDMQGRKDAITKIELDEENILPCRAFSCVELNQSKVYEGYLGNVRRTKLGSFTHATHIHLGRCNCRVQ